MIEGRFQVYLESAFFVPIPMISSRNRKYRELELEFEE